MNLSSYMTSNEGKPPELKEEVNVESINCEEAGLSGLVMYV